MALLAALRAMLPAAGDWTANGEPGDVAVDAALVDTAATVGLTPTDEELLACPTEAATVVVLAAIGLVLAATVVAPAIAGTLVAI